MTVRRIWLQKRQNKRSKKKNFRDPLVVFGENHKKKLYALYYEEQVFDLDHIKKLDVLFKSMSETFGEIEFILIFQVCDKKSLLGYLKESFSFKAYQLEQEAQYEVSEV